MPAAPPNDLTVTSLRGAKGEELSRWIEGANAAAVEGGRERPFKRKRGKNDEQRMRLAEYYGLDLSVRDEPPAKSESGILGQSTVDASAALRIRQEGWASLRQGADEMAELGEKFSLLGGWHPTKDDEVGNETIPASTSAISHDAYVSQPLPGPLAALPSSGLYGTNETGVIAPIASRSVAVLQQYSQLYIMDATTHALVPFSLSLPTSHPASSSLASASSSSLLHHTSSSPAFIPTTSSALALSLTPSTSTTTLPRQALPPPSLPSSGSASSVHVAQSASSIIHNSELPILPPGPEPAYDLADIITLHKDGKIATYMETYGPPPGGRIAQHKAWWAVHKKTVSRHNVIATEVFEGDFEGDEDRFFAFFKQDQASLLRKPKDTDKCVSSAKLYQARTRMKEDLKAEKATSKYTDSAGNFSEEVWKRTWTGKNNWEVWRELGKERY